MNEVTQTKQQILFLATNAPKRGIDDEKKEINAILQGRNSGFDLIPIDVTQVVDVSDAIQNRTPRPQIIHFSGDGKETGELKIPEENTKEELLNPETLAGYFQDATYVKCVLLNFCFSSQAAKLISQHIQYVIGIEDFIGSRAAVQFSQSFYRSLEGNLIDKDTVREAFSKGDQAAYQRTEDNGKYTLLINLQPEMELIKPAEESPVPWQCKCSGTFKNLPTGASMWAYVNATIQGKFYLVLIKDYSHDGTWRITLVIGPEHDDHDYRIGVLIVSPEATEKLNRDYQEAIEKYGFFALDNLPTIGIQTFGDRSVTRQ